MELGGGPCLMPPCPIVQVVRDINERQARELGEAAAELRRARELARELRAQLEQLQAAHALATREAEVSGQGLAVLRSQ
jgi:hypothetical protein